MNDNKVFSRQLELIKPSELDFSIGVIGAGGIGSWATLALAKMGCREITVYDFDKVEEQNIPSQIYSPEDIGKYKVDALSETIHKMTGVDIYTVPNNFQESSYDKHKFLICAVDSLDERRKIWTEIIKTNPLFFDVFLDARMAKELIKIHIVSPFSPYSVKKYLHSINTSIPAYEESCTAKSVVYNTFMCGGLIASIVKKYAKKEEVKSNITFDITNFIIL